MRTEVVIVGAGPSGLATSACLNLQSIPNIVLEREDCSASLWKKKSYDCLKLHLPKQSCQLPHMPHSSTTPTYMPKDLFIQYLDNYESHFKVTPRYCRLVESASYDGGSWRVVAKNTVSGEIEEYDASFLVVASGETCDAFVPEVPGLDGFKGSVLHSTEYKSGGEYGGKDVLVVGSGNSGMEIALDLCNHGARTSIVVRSPIHVLSGWMVSVGVLLSKLLPFHLLDSLVVMLSKFMYGDLTKYGIRRPEEGPFYLKLKQGKFPVIDVGTTNKIKSGEIQVLPALTAIRDSELEFANGELHYFDTIIFATGFRRSIDCWLKDKDNILDKDGFPKPSYPQHWKGNRGLYCVGLVRKGFYGLSMDAQCIADDIKMLSKGSTVRVSD
ncbi:hypothetical protein MRB53_031662 [Persea americana]|uniref:Uncharacterized protein n=1 Tax=Persea americana TaxID=3435 RepID=A0ACC2KPZ5_PERAE|nr:hypothetical protein MRB53_031662 [Persea americana]